MSGKWRTEEAKKSGRLLGFHLRPLAAPFTLSGNNREEVCMGVKFSFGHIVFKMSRKKH